MSRAYCNPATAVHINQTCNKKYILGPHHYCYHHTASMTALCSDNNWLALFADGLSESICFGDCICDRISLMAQNKGWTLHRECSSQWQSSQRWSAAVATDTDVIDVATEFLFSRLWLVCTVNADNKAGTSKKVGVVDFFPWCVFVCGVVLFSNLLLRF
jgi:hypothetical protein